ncbi:17159_t:CDS:2 [Rhizophagus irregularis]|nr:17159_t:CDS:2 [Rhizophagus irregularis]
MSESLSRSLFPQFTEEWVEVGRPYEEHEEVLMNLKFENGSSQTRSVALAEIPGANRQTGKTSNGTLSTIRTQTTACKEGKYCSQDSGPEKLTKYTNQMHRDLQKDNILNDEITDREKPSYQCEEEYAKKLERAKLENQKIITNQIKMENDAYLSAES